MQTTPPHHHHHHLCRQRVPRLLSGPGPKRLVRLVRAAFDYRRAECHSVDDVLNAVVDAGALELAWEQLVSLIERIDMCAHDELWFCRRADFVRMGARCTAHSLVSARLLVMGEHAADELDCCRAGVWTRWAHYYLAAVEVVCEHFAQRRTAEVDARTRTLCSTFIQVYTRFAMASASLVC